MKIGYLKTLLRMKVSPSFFLTVSLKQSSTIVNVIILSGRERCRNVLIALPISVGNEGYINSNKGSWFFVDECDFGKIKS